MKSISKEGRYWFVRENGEIVFQGPTEEDCKRFIRREAVTFFRYGMADKAGDSEAYKMIWNIFENLPERKQEVFDRFFSRLRSFGYGCDAHISETQNGIYIKAENSPCGFSCYIKNDGTVTRKPRTETYVSSLTGWCGISFA